MQSGFNLRRLGFGLAIAAALTATAVAQSGTAGQLIGKWGVDLTDQDRTVPPGDDFYRYQNGAWLARTTLGPGNGQAAYWRDVRNLAPQRIAGTLAGFARDHSLSPRSRDGKAGAFYAAFVDGATVEQRGMTPLKPLLDTIRAIGTPRDLARVTGWIAGPGTLRAPSITQQVGWSLFQLEIDQDRGNPDRYALYVGQGGVILPGPEYYVEPQFADVRAAYQAYIEKLLTIIDWPDAARMAPQIVAFETRMARASSSHQQLAAARNTYGVMKVADLAAFAPGFNWKAMLAGAGLSSAKHVVLDATEAFPKLAMEIAQTPLAVLKARQAFAAVDANAANLTEAVATATRNFRRDMLGNGMGLGLAREIRAAMMSEACIGDIVSAVYVERFASPAARDTLSKMAAAMVSALDSRLAHSAWLSPTGRTRARAKLARIRINVGYPDRFDEYQGLELASDDLFGNVARAAEYSWRKKIRLLTVAYDRAAWQLMPVYPNYNYIASTNTVEIPAALLTPPFFDPRADAAVNYGAVGTLVGQMIVSAFTPNNVVYDGAGRLNPWLPVEDSAALGVLVRKLGQQYSSVEPLPGLHIKGDLVGDEAVGDIGGTEIALAAYHASLEGREVPVLDGFTGDQRFFLGRAQMWRAKFPPAFVRTQIATGVNAPPFMRVNGSVVHIDGWYHAFDVRPGQKMFVAPADRIRIW